MRYIVVLKAGVNEDFLTKKYNLRDLDSYKNLNMFSFEFDELIDKFSLSNLINSGKIKSISEDVQILLDVE